MFTKNYDRLVKVLPIKSLTLHFVKDEIISFDEEETVTKTVDRSEAACMVLRKIGSSLEAHLTTSFDKLLSIMEQYGGAPCIELVNEMRRDLPQDITGNYICSYIASNYIHCTYISYIKMIITLSYTHM